MQNKAQTLENSIKKELNINSWRRNFVGIASLVNGTFASAYFIDGKISSGVLYTSMALVAGLFAYDSHLKAGENKSALGKYK